MVGTKRDQAVGEPQPGELGRVAGERAEVALALVGRPQGSAQVLALRGPQGGSTLSSFRQKRSGLDSWGTTSFPDTASLASWQRGQSEHSTKWIHHRIETTLSLIVKTDKGHGKRWPVRMCSGFIR